MLKSFKGKKLSALLKLLKELLKKIKDKLVSKAGEKNSDNLIPDSSTVSKVASEYKDIAQSRLNNIRSRMPNNDLAKRGNMATADVKITGIKNEFNAHSKINSISDKGADVADFSL